MPLKSPDLTKFSTPSRVLASYSYTDVANGTGVELYYGINFGGDSGIGLSPNYLTSTDGSSTITISAGDIDLDSYNLARTVKGVGYVSFHYGSGTTGVITVQYKKVSGGVETNVSEAISSDSVAAGKEVSFKIPVTQTKFSKGDSFRVTITMPLNGRIYPNNAEQFRVFVPYDIEQ